MPQTIDAPCLPIGPRFGGDGDGNEILTAHHQIHEWNYYVRFRRADKAEALRAAMQMYRDHHIGVVGMVALSARIREACGDVSVPGKGWVDA